MQKRMAELMRVSSCVVADK